MNLLNILHVYQTLKYAINNVIKLYLRGEKMNVLVACEESQRVCTAFREKGHNAFDV